MEDDRLAQPDDSMFERNVIHIAKRAREVEIWVEGVAVPRVGFLAGLDDQFLQLCLTDNQSLCNIDIDRIAIMEETGNTINSYARDGNLEELSINRIKEKIKHFQSKATAILNNK